MTISISFGSRTERSHPRNEDFVQLAPSDAPFSALRSPNWMRTRGAKPDAARRQQRKRALRSFEWVSAWLSGIIPSGAPPPTPRRSPPRGSGERRALTPLLSPNHRLFARNRLVNLLSRHMLGLTACAIPRQLDDSIPRENYPHESAKGQKKAVRVVRQGRPIKIDGLYLRQYSGSSTSSALHTSMQASRQAASAFSRLPLASIAAEASVMTWVSNPSRAASIAVNETQ